jgi:V-type H+-transporting ATPase subunit a
MGLFRSEDMSLYEVSVPKDNAWDIMNTLGRLDAMHFIDLNTDEQPFNLTFVNWVKRCDDTLRRISLIKDECVRLGVHIKKPKSPQQFLDNISAMHRGRKKSASLYFEEVEIQMKEKEKFVAQQTDVLKNMHGNLNRLIEYKTVLSKAASVIGTGRVNDDLSIDSALSNSKSVHESFLDAQEIAIGHIAGTILQEEQDRFNRLIFRATRGNAIVCFRPFTNPITDYMGRVMMKTTFIVIFQDGEFIRDRIIRICDSFMGDRFEIPTSKFTDTLQDLETKIRDAKKILTHTKEETRKYLRMINTMENEESSAIAVYEWYVVKERYVYDTLNKLKKGDKLFFGLYWIPNPKIAMVNEAIYKMKQDRNIQAPQITRRGDHGMNPPSYFYLNDFTAPFQEITDTYGVPMYKEVNAGIFNLVTFPFLFGVMFGDIGHGGMMLIFGTCLIMFPSLFERVGLNAMTRVRYLIFMLGLFSTFSGFCYNDFMSIPLELPVGSCYTTVHGPNGPEAELMDDCVYPIGFDPKWFMGKNALTYFNSMKMKLSVIFGVSQMSLGIIMKGFNYVHFRKPVDFFFEFIPQLVLMLCLFGYMDLMIITKWMTDWTGREAGAPPVIATMIGMFLRFGQIPDNTEALFTSPSYQQGLSQILLLIGLTCVPIMLFVKPLHWLSQQKDHGAHKDGHSALLNDDSDGEVEMHDLSHSKGKIVGDKLDDEEAHPHAHADKPPKAKGDKQAKLKVDLNKSQQMDDLIKFVQGSTHSNHDFSEVFIHQLIETIEFVLGTVSNTASYLRLWALSLAHSQLAAVFFEKLLGDLALESNDGKGSGILLFLLFPAFFSMTFFVLMCMDAMECFLH